MTPQELKEIRERWQYTHFPFAEKDIHRLLDEVERLQGALSGAANIANHSQAIIHERDKEIKNLKDALRLAYEVLEDHQPQWYTMGIYKIINQALGHE